ncbi:MAG: tRNA (adenosine(37)-N6)-threonylcarbamoyltransferase complex ATPase subunit type 1 TsaE [Cyclobacteriaceae bacterium]
MRHEGKRQQVENVTLADLEHVGKMLMQALNGIRVVVLYGDMGAGKTTFVKAIGHVLGVQDVMSSPTFSIVNEYGLAKDQKIFHFDFYRIKNETEAFDIGVEEYFDSGHYCFVEWPEKIPSLLPAKYAEVYITNNNDTHRTIAFSIHDGEEKDRV